MKQNFSLSLLLSIAGIITFITIIALSAIWVPARMWTGSAVFSMVVFAIAVATNIYFPGFFPPSRKVSNASDIASIMPNAIIITMLMFFSGVTFIISLYGYEKLSWTMNLINLSLCIIAIIYNSFFLGVISDLPKIDNSQVSSQQWIVALRELGAYNAIREKDVLDKIIEEIEFGPSGHYPDDQEINDKVSLQISKLVSDAKSNIKTSAEIREEITQLSALIDNRKNFLKNLRTQSL